MGENSKIEWTDHTFNPWIGCVKVSPGCQHCYAEAQNKRWGKDLWGVDKPRQVTSDAYWKQPFTWNAEAEAAGERRRVFCASMADVFEDRPDLIEPRGRLIELIAATPALDWLLLTKRPQGILDRLDEVVQLPRGDEGDWIASQWLDGNPPANVWLGTSVENQKVADERIPHLLRVPAAVRFLSCEPLLGEIDIEHHLRKEGIDWVIVGGESGHGARPMHPQWARGLRDQCEMFGVSFFFKQWGEWFPRDEWEYNPELVLPDDSDAYTNDTRTRVFIDAGELYPMHRVGKQRAGRLLNGRSWNEFPKPHLAQFANQAKQESLF